MFIPDLLTFYLCGRKISEFTFATTSQLYNPFKGTWEEDLLKAVGLEASFMNEIISPGQVLGDLKVDIAGQTGIKKAEVSAVCSHDTGSAIVAVPAKGDDWAYISSGTWSLMGLELTSPLVNSKSFKYNFSNEGGAGGRFRFLKNIMGLWLLQQCRKKWADSGNNFSYDELITKASCSAPFGILIDPDNKIFFNPPDMITAINDFCEQSSQRKPADAGEYVRAILESLALKYREILDQLIETSGRQISTIHIIGGGALNKLLCQFTANATGRKVIAGPAEGTAAGNILMQAIAHQHAGSVEEVREIVKNSFDLTFYLPCDTQKWDSAYNRFLRIAEKT
jgi:rhamnulokinase